MAARSDRRAVWKSRARLGPSSTCRFGCGALSFPTAPTNLKAPAERLQWDEAAAPSPRRRSALRAALMRLLTCRVGDDTPAPDCSNQLVFADNPLAIADQVLQQVEHLQLPRKQLVTATEFPPIAVKRKVFKHIPQPRWVRRKGVRSAGSHTSLWLRTTRILRIPTGLRQVGGVCHGNSSLAPADATLNMSRLVGR